VIRTSYAALNGGIRQRPDAAGLARALIAKELPAYAPRLVSMPVMRYLGRLNGQSARLALEALLRISGAGAC
jgi:hypothetical protein